MPRRSGPATVSTAATTGDTATVVVDADASGATIDETRVDEYVGRLYRSALAVAPERYRPWALEQLAEVIPHDGALWGSGSMPGARFHTVSVVGLPESFPAQLEATHAINPLLPRIMSNLAQPVDMQSVLADPDYHRSEIYRRVFAPLSIERILSTAHLDPRSGLYTLMTLYRRDPAASFTEAERRAQKRITYHLFNAASHAFFIQELQRRDLAPGSVAAVVDRAGIFHEVQPRFLDLLDAHFPRRAAPQTLPFRLPEEGSTTLIDGLVVQCQAHDDRYLIHLHVAGPLDRLTQREREVVNAVAQGLSFKQAARKIGVAPSTVANHLYRVYRKLGVGSRTELAALVYPG